MLLPVESRKAVRDSRNKFPCLDCVLPHPRLRESLFSWLTIFLRVEEAAAKARHAAGVTSGEAAEKANELKHDAKGKAYEAEGKVKGTMEQAKGKM